jgi:hypothetical protein
MGSILIPLQVRFGLNYVVMGMHFTLEEKADNRRTREQVINDLYLIGFPKHDEDEDDNQFYLRTGMNENNILRRFKLDEILQKEKV